jgi:hypothetical protein
MGVVHPGPLNPNWRGGRHIASNGYVKVRVGAAHHLADSSGYAYEHRLVAEEKICRRLLKGEIVHHVDGDKTNNAPENLEVEAGVAEHFVHHRRSGKRLRNPGEPNRKISCSCGCGETFDEFDSSGRPRKFVSGHNDQPAPSLSGIKTILSDGPSHRAAIAEAIGSTVQATATALSRLRAAGLVKPVGSGRWALNG